MAQLVLRLRDRELGRFPILTRRITLGRDTASDLVIDNAAVSRTHALVTFEEDNSYRVHDAGSQNGITVNGRPVKSAVLAYGDVIGIGKFEVELMQSTDFPVRAGGAVPTTGARNIMRTMEMDGATAARIREEVMARLAAQKDQQSSSDRPASARAGSARTASARTSSARPNARPRPKPARRAVGGSDVLAVIKLAAWVLLAVGAVVGGALYLLSR